MFLSTERNEYIRMLEDKENNSIYFLEGRKERGRVWVEEGKYFLALFYITPRKLKKNKKPPKKVTSIVLGEVKYEKHYFSLYSANHVTLYI